MEKLSWIFELIDRVSAPASSASKSIDRVDASMRRADATSSGFTARVRTAGASFSRFTFAILPTVVALGQIANAGILVSNAMKLMGVNTATLRAGFDAIKGGAARAVASLRAFGTRALAALRRIPASAYVAAAAVAGVGLAAYGAKRALSAILSPLRSLMSTALSAAPYVAMAAALMTAKGALDAIVARQRLVAGIEMMDGIGSGEAGARRMAGLADRLGQNVNTFAQSIMTLRRGGFAQEEAFQLAQGLADVAATNPAARIDGLVLAMGQVRRAGRLQGDELMQLADAGLNTEAVFGRIAAAMGISSTEVSDAISQRRVTADIFSNAVLGTMGDQAGGVLGSIAERMSHTLGGEIERLQNAPDRFFERVAAGSGATSERLTASVRRLNEFLNPESAQGQRVVAALTNALEDLAGWLDTATQDTTKFENTMTGIGAVLNTVVFLFRGLGALVNTLNASLGLARFVWQAFDDAAISAGNTINSTIDGMTTAITDFGVKAYDLGVQVVQGLVNGLISMQFAPAGVITGMAANMVTALRTALGIHSPSRVFAYMGEMTGLGFNEGLESTGMSAALNGTIAAPALGSPEAMAALGGNTIQINITVEGGESTRETAEEIGEIVMSRLALAFDSLTIESGL